ncbi:MAG TPA: carboxypeptidase regulatory-like domain-containing protein, partial [Pyrinomonadaceae bacterium]
MRNYLPRFFFVLAVIVVFSLSAFGQNTSTGSLTGTVVDPQGAVVAGAVVTVKSVSNQEFTAVTNGEGFFTIPAL